MGVIGCYVRVSTADQNLQRQIDRTQEYARERLGADLAEIELYRDKSTGTDTARSGYRELMRDVEGGELDAVVVHETSRLCRSIADLERTADQFRAADVELHIVAEGLTITGDEDPYQKALFQLLGVFAELEANIRRQNIREGIVARQESEDYHHGPAPLGFEKDSGELVESENYERVVEVLDMVAKGELSKRKAAKELDTSRRTIRRAVNERTDLYGL